MQANVRRLTLRAVPLVAAIVVFLALAPWASGRKNSAHLEIVGHDTTAHSVLWRQPEDIASRDLFYGPGGAKDQPHGTFTFEKEDLDGTSPKFTVRDEDGVKWKVKLGEEARPETAASRLVWAAGYFTDEDYFLAELNVRELPARLHRGRKFVSPNGIVRNARLKRYLKGEEKTGEWMWRNDPFAGSREWNGLRIMMALINNWDLKDSNNTVYEDRDERIYVVSDLGASFGRTGWGATRAASKGNLNAYRHSKFIRRVAADYVDFNFPSRPLFIHLVDLPDYIHRVHLKWIGQKIPRTDARWIGQMLAQLSTEQIHAAFRAAGYSPEEVDGFSEVVESRIAELSDL